MNIIAGVNYLNKKKILLRVDFDVPVSEDGKIQESFRLKKQKYCIGYLLAKGARVTMVAHITSVNSFRKILPELEQILGSKINFIENIEGLRAVTQDNEPALFLLENIRQNQGEEKNDKELAKAMALGQDLYVNNAFAVSHREHASVSAITEYLPSYAGPILEEESLQLEKVISAPAEGKILIMGGAKASTKVPVIKNFLSRVDKILVGGVIANDILKKEGVELNGSKFDNDIDTLLAGLDIRHYKLIMPVDYNISEGKYLDIGPSSLEKFGQIISEAKIIIWNGPMGFFEDERFAIGTNGIARAVMSSNAFKIVGGGDTISALDKIGIIDRFDFISTGGGAMLSFLSGDKLPGLEALGYYQ